MHPLLEALTAAAEGRFPPADGVIEVHRPAPDGTRAVVELTGHAYVLTERDPGAVRARGRDAFGGAGAPDFLRWLAGPTGWIGSHDVVLVARGRGDGSLPRRVDLDGHPRVVRAHRHRRDVEVYGDDVGIVVLGCGLVDRRELSVELLDGGRSGVGEGRRLVAEGLALVPAGALVWAQVAPGNARSLRAFLACGFVPVGAETLLA